MSQKQFDHFQLSVLRRSMEWKVTRLPGIHIRTPAQERLSYRTSPPARWPQLLCSMIAQIAARCSR
jgi:hypothetical protein